MLDAARARFAGDSLVDVVACDLDEPLPDLGRFDVVVSAFAIHHCSHARKRVLYAEVFDTLEPGGVFYNLEHVASATPRLHQHFLDALGITAEQEDRSNQLLDVETQLAWLREIGFRDVDCHWKWRELALPFVPIMLLSFGASYANVAQAATFDAGTEGTIEVMVTNTGTVSWPAGGDNPVRLSYHWLRDGQMVVWDGVRTPLARGVEPGDRLRAALHVRGPIPPGEERAFDARRITANLGPTIERPEQRP